VFPSFAITQTWTISICCAALAVACLVVHIRCMLTLCDLQAINCRLWVRIAFVAGGWLLLSVLALTALFGPGPINFFLLHVMPGLLLDASILMIESRVLACKKGNLPTS
ncbi:hypothetical protein PENTCL1PPCAC_25234, partial [Pristionchus entomophagus]